MQNLAPQLVQIRSSSKCQTTSGKSTVDLTAVLKFPVVGWKSCKPRFYMWIAKYIRIAGKTRFDVEEFAKGVQLLVAHISHCISKASIHPLLQDKLVAEKAVNDIMYLIDIRLKYPRFRAEWCFKESDVVKIEIADVCFRDATKEVPNL